MFATGVLHLWHPAADRSRAAGQRQEARRRCVASERVRARRRHVADAPTAGTRPLTIERRDMTLQATGISQVLDRERWTRLADGLAIALAVSLPWSTSATGILIVLWLIVAHSDARAGGACAAC